MDDARRCTRETLLRAYTGITSERPLGCMFTHFCGSPWMQPDAFLRRRWSSDDLLLLLLLLLLAGKVQTEQEEVVAPR